MTMHFVIFVLIKWKLQFLICSIRHIQTVIMLWDFYKKLCKQYVMRIGIWKGRANICKLFIHLIKWKSFIYLHTSSRKRGFEIYAGDICNLFFTFCGKDTQTQFLSDVVLVNDGIHQNFSQITQNTAYYVPAKKV